MGEAGANIKITGEAPYVQNWLAESDIPIPEQVELNRFREATREENIRIHDLTAECMKLLPKIRAKDSVAKQEFASIRQTVNSIHDEIILQKELLLMLDYDYRCRSGRTERRCQELPSGKVEG